ncbi:heterokaryon incompatibility protein-domain-containing protein [Xylaria bambusicola]|uniref:heterokaryon incompatibility protein-domain-containing protein n=1 Tax=Xylaria bambusicola TaxID=326684 RepID=UPI002008BF25|nr:heterokaryon incompatibility protein-domain-containing protein [Xylaria bambusicola]KAI0523802.1 heterokaryon incompatibility protein-domain-containing protein [Xylaria bambusicola]
MWLIHTQTMKLHQLVDVEETPYAILSHTWEDEEVTFQEFHDLEKARQKKGFVKIHETCRIAASRGLHYAWVDTCCIDKSSSAELSESINSMFKWYQASEVCIVFLSDLPPNSSPFEDTIKFPHQFPRCRWLTRGFTLQELIASSRLLFYDSSWNCRGTKSEWKSLISNTTGIDLDVLEDPECLSSVPVGRRMSWAAKRKTQREEDRAYCLLGIFDVNMPLIYGEGGKAFMRLQQEIAKQTCDLTLFAWQQEGPDPPYRGILAQSSAEFANCGSLKHKIRDANLTNEYTFTNKGLRIETALVTVPSVSEDYIWNLGCSWRDDWSKLEIQGYLGVFLAKTANGYVRVQPNLLFEAGIQRRGRNLFGAFYMQAHLTKLEFARINRCFEGAVCVRFPETLRIRTTAPEALWDQNRSLFFNHGQGINGYIHLQLDESSERDFRRGFIVAYSTMERPLCVIWQQYDHAFSRVQGFMKSKVLADYVAADYLRLRFGSQYSDAATSRASTLIVDPSSSMFISILVELQEHEYQGQRGFVLNIHLSRGQRRQ